jgi:hypothetical protein
VDLVAPRIAQAVSTASSAAARRVREVCHEPRAFSRSSPASETTRYVSPSGNHTDLQRGARIEAGAEAAAEPRAPERGGASEGAVASEHLGAIGRRGERHLARGREGDAAGRVLVVRVARQDGARRLGR